MINGLGSGVENFVKLEALNQVVHLFVASLVHEVRIQDLLLALFVQGQEIYLGLAFDSIVLVHGFLLQFFLAKCKQFAFVLLVEVIPVLNEYPLQILQVRLPFLEQVLCVHFLVARVLRGLLSRFEVVGRLIDRRLLVLRLFLSFNAFDVAKLLGNHRVHLREQFTTSLARELADRSVLVVRETQLVLIRAFDRRCASNTFFVQRGRPVAWICLEAVQSRALVLQDSD